MPHNYKHDTTRRFDSKLFPGITVILRKMTEGRRLELRKLVSEPNKRIREILKEQAQIEKEPEDVRDSSRWLDLQDECDGIMLSQLNPAWITWGVKQIEGLEVDGRSLGVEDWMDWPSALADEVLVAVKDEAELNGTARKNSESLTIFGEPADSSQKVLIAESAENEGGGEQETVTSITRTM